MRLMRLVSVVLWSLVGLAAAPTPSYVREQPEDGARPTTAGGVYGHVRRVTGAMRRDAALAEVILRRLYELQPNLDERMAYDIALETARWSRNTGVRWRLLVAIMWHESRFDPNAVSRTNDHGLFQLHARPIYGIGENIRQGSAHIAGCLAAANGNERMALAAYNGGPGGWRIGRCRAYADSVLSLCGASE